MTETAEIPDTDVFPVAVKSYHYDVFMRLLKIKLEEENGVEFWITPTIFPDGTAGLQRCEIND